MGATRTKRDISGRHLDGHEATRRKKHERKQHEGGSATAFRPGIGSVREIRWDMLGGVRRSMRRRGRASRGNDEMR